MFTPGFDRCPTFPKFSIAPSQQLIYARIDDILHVRSFVKRGSSIEKSSSGPSHNIAVRIQTLSRWSDGLGLRDDEVIIPSPKRKRLREGARAM